MGYLRVTSRDIDALGVLVDVINMNGLMAVIADSALKTATIVNVPQILTPKYAVSVSLV